MPSISKVEEATSKQYDMSVCNVPPFSVCMGHILSLLQFFFNILRGIFLFDLSLSVPPFLFPHFGGTFQKPEKGPIGTHYFKN